VALEHRSIVLIMHAFMHSVTALATADPRPVVTAGQRLHERKKLPHRVWYCADSSMWTGRACGDASAIFAG